MSKTRKKKLLTSWKKEKSPAAKKEMSSEGQDKEGTASYRKTAKEPMDRTIRDDRNREVRAGTGGSQGGGVKRKVFA